MWGVDDLIKLKAKPLEPHDRGGVICVNKVPKGRILGVHACDVAHALPQKGGTELRHSVRGQ